MYKHIVHAHDGTDNSIRALDAALELARAGDAKLDILIIEELYPKSGSLYEVRREKAVADRKANRLKRDIEERAGRSSVSYRLHVFAGPAIAHITEFVHDTRADLLVIGASEHVSMIELIIGRRSDRIAHYAGCSVLIAR
jgi:nucleotide-binding universal stress UspA family protein